MGRLLILLVATCVGGFAVRAIHAPPHPDTPPPAHTGGFGEKTCQACHFDGPVSPGDDFVSIGVPEAWQPGKAYALTVRFSSPGMLRAGFELSVRHPDGRQAGALAETDDRVQTSELGGVLYASQSEAGSFARADTARWTVAWTAPLAGDSLRLHLAANAGNGDNSPLGDNVYVLAQTLTRQVP